MSTPTLAIVDFIDSSDLAAVIQSYTADSRLSDRIVSFFSHSRSRVHIPSEAKHFLGFAFCITRS
jgi:hypothetical protein